MINPSLKREVITLWVDAPTKAAITQAARIDRITISQWMRNAIEEQLTKEENGLSNLDN